MQWSLLAINNGPFLQVTYGALRLLKNDSTKKMRVVFRRRLAKKPFADALDILPKWFPLALFVPNVRALKQGNNKPLWLLENHLGRTDLGVHGALRFLNRNKRRFKDSTRALTKQ